MGDEREREREREITRNMRKKWVVRVLVFGLNITYGFFVGNRLMKRIVSVKYFTNEFSIGKNDSGGNFIFQIPTENSSVKKEK